MSSLKNIAIVAHVDHGKTTLIDGILKMAGAFNEREEVADRVMDSGELEKERGITITAKNCAINWKGHKINLLDTPGHADFGGEVERSLKMVDSVLLLVDAAEGPLPQTRFVLDKAIAQNLKIAVIINKVDRPDSRVDEVKSEIEDLFLELADLNEVADFDFDFPLLYASGKNGWAALNYPEEGKDFAPLLDLLISDQFPTPKVSPGNDLQLLVCNLSYSPYLGQLLIGRIQRGNLKHKSNYNCAGKGGKNRTFRASSVQVFDSLGTKEVDMAEVGEIVLVAGIEGVEIGDTITSVDNIEALERIEVSPPTVSVLVSVNTSPLAGREGDYLTSRKIEEFLQEACLKNVALKYEATDDPKVYFLKGRGELQLAIVFEEWRRAGFEFMVGRPQVVYRTKDGQKEEPLELFVLDVPNDTVGAVTERVSERKGIMQNLSPIGELRTRLDFEIPSRGLIGLRSLLLTDTRGEGLLSSQFLGYTPYKGDMLSRVNGAIISDRAGKMTPYALFALLSSGRQFVVPGMETYEGMVIGEHGKTNDLNVNCTKEKHLSSVRTAGKDTNVMLPPVRPLTLEWALSWIEEDEWVEVTPKNIRLRKQTLPQNKRSVIR